MAKQIVNEMATNLTLDSKSASQALKELTREVKNSSAEAKILENQYKASGDAVSSSKAKYEGLQSTLEAQKTKIEALKSGLDNVNTSTKKGQDLQQYLTNELAKAERQYASYNGQLEKAKQAYTYQESGLAKLNNELKHGNDLTEARVQKLQAEGREDEANKVKLENLKNVQKNYTEQLSIQKTELGKLAESGDKNSDAYKRQELRVEQMSAKVAESTRDIKHFNSTEIKPETRGISSAKNKLNELDDKLTSTSSHFKSVFLGNLAANAVTNAFESMKEKLSETVQGAIEYNKQMQVMDATWTTLTGDADKSKEMVSGIKSISTAFGQTTDLTNELEQQFYHVFNQKEPTEQLTKSVLTMADTIGLSSDATERLGLNFTHMMTSSKMQLGDFNVITDQLPMFGEKLLEFEQEAQHNTNLTMSQLRDQMSAGKISAEDAEKVMNELGDKYKTASENMLQTASGMERVVSARGEALAGALISPIMNAKNPIFGAISKWVSDDRTEKEFNKVGESISHTFSTITEAFGKEFKANDFTEAADKALDGMAKNIERFGDYIAAHKDQIIGFFSATKDLSGTGFSVMGDTLKIAMPLLEDLGQFAQKHPERFKIMAESIIAINLAFKGMHGAVQLANTVLNTFDGIASGIKWGAKVLGIESETKAIQEQNVALSENNTLMQGGIGASTTKTATKTVAKEVGTVATGSATTTGATSLASALSKALPYVGVLAGLAQAGTSLYAGTQTKDQTKQRADYTGAGVSVGGTALGAAIGSAVAPGIGTAIGAALGGTFGLKLGKKLGADLQNGFKESHPKSLAAWIGEDWDEKYKSQSSATMKKFSSDYNSQIGKLNSNLSLKLSVDTKDNDKNKQKIEGIYKDLQKVIDDFYKKQNGSTKKNLDTLVKNGAITKKQEDDILKNSQDNNKKKADSQKKLVDDMKKSTSNYYDDAAKINSGGTKTLEGIANKYGTNSKKYKTEQHKELESLQSKHSKVMADYEVKLDDKVSKASQVAATKQEDILSSLNNSKKKLNLKDILETERTAEKNHEVIVKNAQKTRDDAVKAANVKYKKTVGAAEQEYYQNHSISKKQYNTIVKNAQDTRDDTIDAAEKQKKGKVKRADEEYGKIVDKAEQQRKDVTSKSALQKDKSIEHAQKQKDGTTKLGTDQKNALQQAASDQAHGVLSKSASQANGSMEAASKQGSGLQKIWNNITDFFNGLVKAFCS